VVCEDYPRKRLRLTNCMCSTSQVVTFVVLDSLVFALVSAAPVVHETLRSCEDSKLGSCVFVPVISGEYRRLHRR
jgi:hypothetical protein